MGHPSRILEDRGAESNVLVHGDLAQEFQRGVILATVLENILYYFGKECVCFLPAF